MASGQDFHLVPSRAPKLGQGATPISPCCCWLLSSGFRKGSMYVPGGPNHNFPPSESASFQQSCRATEKLSSYIRVHRLVRYGKLIKKKTKQGRSHTCLSGVVTCSQGLHGNRLCVLPISGMGDQYMGRLFSADLPSLYTGHPLPSPPTQSHTLRRGHSGCPGLVPLH